MKKAILALILICSLCLTGCATMLEREYISINSYKPETNTTDSSSSLRVESYQELVNAILYLVTMGEEQGVLSLYNYTQDVESDLVRACQEVLQEDPLGAYSVEYITHDYSLIVSYYEVNLHITYRRSREQVSSITSITGSGAIRQVISRALTSFSPESVLRVSYFTESEESIQELLEQAYYNSPATAFGMPETEITIYPDTGSQRIVEILMTYPDHSDVLRTRSQELMVIAQALASDAATHQAIYDIVSENLVIVENPEKSSAYDALFRHECSSEGAALAYQLLCDQAGLPCTLVRGFRNGVPHFWNIVTDETGESRHVDLSASLAFLTDEELTGAGGYFWDAKEYPSCVAPAPADLPEEAPTEISEEEIEEN